MKKTFRIDNGPTTITGMPITGGSVEFNAAGEYTTADPSLQAVLEEHPLVKESWETP